MNQKGFLGTPTIVLLVIIAVLSLGLWLQYKTIEDKTQANGRLVEKLNIAEEAIETLSERNKTAAEVNKVKDSKILILQEEKTKLADSKAVVEKQLGESKRKLPKTLTVVQVTSETPEEFQQSVTRIETAWAFYCTLEPTDTQCKPPLSEKAKA